MKNPGLWLSFGRAGTAGLVLVFSTFIGFAAGYYLDKWLKTGPWLSIIFLVLGIAAGFLNIFETFLPKKKD